MQKRTVLKCAGVLALCGIGLFGCAKKQETSKAAGPPLEFKVVESRVVTAGNEFGFDVLKRLSASQQNSNVLISPLSISSALAMVYNGASGATQTEMAQTLRLGVLPLETVNKSNAALRFNLATAIPRKDPRIELAIANSLWAKKGVDFNPPFLEVNKKFYDAKVTSLDLSTPAAMNAMNDWVKQKTKGKIKKMFDAPPGADARLILLNAVYFNGKWQNQFDKSETKDAPFHLQNKKQKQVPMMSGEGEYSYAKTKESAIVELPYGNGDLNLVLLLPDKNVSLDSLLSKISAKNWDEWRTQMSSQKVMISIPRFKMNAETDFSDTLPKMGMKTAFSEVADYGKMRVQKDLFLSSVRQKAVVEVSEEGTKAAATDITIHTQSYDDRPFQFIADRPFLGAICDTHSGAILFLMIVREP